MSELSNVITAIERHNDFVEEQICKARQDKKFAAELVRRWRKILQEIPTTATPTGLKLPRLALPATEEPAEIARYIFGEGLPGEFPFVTAAYPQMYLEKPEAEQGSGSNKGADKSTTATAKAEEPTRLFAGLGLAEDTNQRFHYLTRHQKSIRLSTAFDGPTLYGMDSDEDGVFGKVGEGGVAVDTVEDMERLFKNFPLNASDFSVSMTINGPAPIILAMYVASAQKRFGRGVLATLRGTVQADILKEVQAQNEIIFPIEASLRFLTDMVEFTTEHMPRWYPISISGYHIAEAGATPVQQAAFTLSNGFAYAEMFRARGMKVDRFAPRLSFFLDCGLDVEYLALGRVCRKLWAIGMRDVFRAGHRGQMLRLHTQTSGRSLIASEYKNNMTRTAIELLMAYANATNSCHSNSADEPFTTPSEEYVRLAAHAQAIVLEESGLFKFMMNSLAGSPGMKIIERALEQAILDEFRQIEQLGGVLSATELRYQRSQIQSAAHRYERHINDGTRPIIGLNRYGHRAANLPEIKVIRTPRAKQHLQIARLKKFKHAHRAQAPKALDRLSEVVKSGGDVFAELLQTVEHCSLGQITSRLQQDVGRFRPMI
jgi:methylmalonyl-CoA mutase cobalamin-binding domain/chain